MNVRQLKLASQIKRLVSDIVARGINDPRISGLISVTKVMVTPDLREARVFISLLGHKGPDTLVLAGIESAARHIQHEVASNLTMRSAPRLSYHLDDSLKREAEILKLVNQANTNSPASLPDKDGADESVEESSED